MRKKPQGSNFVKIIKIRNTKIIQMNQMQLNSQTPSPTEITKTLSTSQPESRIIDYQYQKKKKSEQENGY